MSAPVGPFTSACWWGRSWLRGRSARTRSTWAPRCTPMTGAASTRTASTHCRPGPNAGRTGGSVPSPREASRTGLAPSSPCRRRLHVGARGGLPGHHLHRPPAPRNPLPLRPTTPPQERSPALKRPLKRGRLPSAKAPTCSRCRPRRRSCAYSRQRPSKESP